MAEKNRIADLIVKELKGGELDLLQKAELDQWINESEANKRLYHQLTDPDLLQQEVADFYQAERKIFQKIRTGISAPEVVPIWKRLAAAAAIIILLGAASYLLLTNRAPKPQMVAGPKANDIHAPQTNRATVVLEDGRKVFLDSVGNGQLAQQDNVKLVKLEDGKLAYQASSGETIKEIKYNTLVNPRGSKVINMQLSDGSHVWLNAGSSVKFPVAFIGNERKVEITGEAYFEVIHDASKPFKVAFLSPPGGGARRAGEVEVLGTHFNVNAYDDEDAVKVTLLEGSVKVTQLATHDSRTIRPGQQASITDNIGVADGVDLDQVMAWKNGRFQFGEKVDIQTIMRQISRWYDVDVEYKGTVTQHFGGSISRQANISQVLKVMEETGGVKFTLDGRKVIVSP